MRYDILLPNTFSETKKKNISNCNTTYTYIMLSASAELSCTKASKTGIANSFGQQSHFYMA